MDVANPAEARPPPDLNALREEMSKLAQEFGVPGVAVGILDRGRAVFASHGVTSVAVPTPVDEATLFQIGSTSKTFTATAIMRLVEAGRVDLDAPVCEYVPELSLEDGRATSLVRVLHLLNHTAGWSGDLYDDTGDGHDAVARYVRRMSQLDQLETDGPSKGLNGEFIHDAGSAR